MDAQKRSYPSAHEGYYLVRGLRVLQFLGTIKWLTDSPLSVAAYSEMFLINGEVGQVPLASSHAHT